jgi:dienelactone hydrolase
MLKIILLIFSVTLAGCAAHIPIALSDAKKPRASVYQLKTHSNKLPTIILSHGSAGVDPHILSVANEFHGWGFNTVVIDHYSQKGISSGLHNVGRTVSGATGSERALDIIAVSRWIKNQPWHMGKIVLVGYSQGGATVNALASKDKILTNYHGEVNQSDYEVFAGAVGVYPSCGQLLDATPPSISSPFPVQLHIASADNLARPEWCLTKATNYQLIYYEGATHGFDFTATNPKFTHRYNPQATKLSLQRMRDFIVKVLK